MSDLTTPKKPEPRATTLIWLGSSLVAAILLRMALWLTYSPVAYSDTPSYRRLAESVLDGFARYDGTRTPGYPAFLALIGPDTRVWVVQMGMGVLVSLILFYLGWQLSRRSWVGGLLAIAHSVNLGQLFFEANLLTETLTAFFLATTFTGVYLLLKPQKHQPWILCAATGTTVSLALLTRPLFVYLPVWVVLFFIFAAVTSVAPYKQLAWKSMLVRLISFSVPVVLLVGGWVLFIHQRFGDWGLTTMTGYHLVQHTGGYFEYVPDEYAELRDTYIQFRDAKIAATGTQTNAIWEAIPEMSRVSGLNFYDLSRTLAQISTQLIREHPDLFLKNVAEGWLMFWRAPMYWSAEVLEAPGLEGAINTLVKVERILLVMVNSIFVIGSLAWLVLCYLPVRWIKRLPAWFRNLQTSFRPERGKPGELLTSHQFMLFVVGNIWITSILQSLLDHGDNPRFLVPLQSFAFLWVVWFILKIWSPQSRNQ